MSQVPDPPSPKARVAVVRPRAQDAQAPRSRLRLLRSDKAPYLLVFMVGLAGWGLTHILHQLLSAPLLEFQQHEPRRGDVIQYSYTITNITPATLFEHLNFVVLMADSDTAHIHRAWTLFHPPAWKRDSDATIKPARTDVTFRISELQPGASIDLNTTLSGPAKLTLRVFTDKGTAVLLVRRSITTVLVRYQLESIALFVVAAGLLIAVFMNYLARLDDSAVDTQVKADE